MPEDDPLEPVDRGLGVLTKLALLPILIDLLLQLVWGMLGGCCWAVVYCSSFFCSSARCTRGRRW